VRINKDGIRDLLDRRKTIKKFENTKKKVSNMSLAPTHAALALDLESSDLGIPASYGSGQVLSTKNFGLRHCDIFSLTSEPWLCLSSPDGKYRDSKKG